MSVVPCFVDFKEDRSLGDEGVLTETWIEFHSYPEWLGDHDRSVLLRLYAQCSPLLMGPTDEDVIHFSCSVSCTKWCLNCPDLLDRTESEVAGEFGTKQTDAVILTPWMLVLEDRSYATKGKIGSYEALWLSGRRLMPQSSLTYNAYNAQ